VTDRPTYRPRYSVGNNRPHLCTYYRPCGLIITSGQSNLITGRIAAAHGRFSGIRQVAPVRNPPNICFLGPTRVQIPNCISIGSAVFSQLTAERNYFIMDRLFPLKIALSYAGDPESHSFGSSEPATQTTSRLVLSFLHISPKIITILYNGRPLLPSKFPLSTPFHRGDLNPHLIHDTLGSSEPTTQTTS